MKIKLNKEIQNLYMKILEKSLNDNENKWEVFLRNNELVNIHYTHSASKCNIRFEMENGVKININNYKYPEYSQQIIMPWSSRFLVFISSYVFTCCINLIFISPDYLVITFIIGMIFSTLFSFFYLSIINILKGNYKNYRRIYKVFKILNKHVQEKIMNNLKKELGAI